MRATPINPGEVVWSGENPIVSLKDNAQGEELTNATFFRIVYSEAGTGHALFLSSRSFGGILAGYTDNMTLGRWLRDRMLPVYPHYVGRDVGTIPLSPASFHSEGEPRTAWREHVKAGTTDIELRWEALGPPFVVNNPGGSTGKFPYHVISLFVPSARATLTLNGEAAHGQAYSRDIAATASSTCFLAFSETWLTLP
jgi:hypothetical protein